jgi:hypothetical protein
MKFDVRTLIQTIITAIAGIGMLIVSLFSENPVEIAQWGVFFAGAYLASKAFCIYLPKAKKD